MRGIQTLPTFGALLGPVTISTALFDHSFVQASDSAILVKTGGVNQAAQRSLTHLLAGFPSAKVRTIDAYVETTQASIDTMLNLFYVLLALSVIISLFGIVNALALSIVERTREIGALTSSPFDGIDSFMPNRQQLTAVPNRIGAEREGDWGGCSTRVLSAASKASTLTWT